MPGTRKNPAMQIRMTGFFSCVMEMMETMERLLSRNRRWTGCCFFFQRTLPVQLQHGRDGEIQDEETGEEQENRRVALRLLAEERDECRADDAGDAPGRENAAVDG